MLSNQQTIAALRAADQVLIPAFGVDLFQIESYQWLKIGTSVAALLSAWHYRVSAETGWPSVSTLWPGETENFVYIFCLSLTARTLVWADPSLRYTSMLVGRETTYHQQADLNCGLFLDEWSCFLAFWCILSINGLKYHCCQCSVNALLLPVGPPWWPSG